MYSYKHMGKKGATWAGIGTVAFFVVAVFMRIAKEQGVEMPEGFEEELTVLFTVVFGSALEMARNWLKQNFDLDLHM